MLEEGEESKEGDGWNQGFDNLAFKTGEIEPEDKSPIKKRSTIFDPADWQERTGWENHLIEKATRPTFDDPERSAMGLVLQKLIDWKAMPYSIIDEERVEELIAEKTVVLQNQIGVS